MAYSDGLAKKGKIALDWPDLQDPKYMEGPLWDGINEFENKYKFKFPPNSYAMFETAFRAAYGMDIVEHKKNMGKLLEHYSNVASRNPYSWSHKSYSAEQVTTPSHENRLINHPYTKRMCSNMFVDQSAAVIMISDELAEKIGIEREKWVYIMGGADIRNVHEITQRPNIYDSPASREGSRLALSQAVITRNTSALIRPST